MRFATVIPSVLFVALLALTNVVAVESQAKNNVAVSFLITKPVIKLKKLIFFFSVN